jgi:hypothetical protein
MLLQRTIDRNELFVEAAKAKLDRQERGLPGEKGEKAARPEDLVSFFLMKRSTSCNIIPTDVFLFSGYMLNMRSVNLCKKLTTS